jgi:hypothetical protein
MLDLRIYAKALYVGFSSAHLTAIGSALNTFCLSPRIALIIAIIFYC